MRVRLLAGSGFVIEKMNVSVANLEKVNMAGDNVTLELEVESTRTVVGDVLSGHKDGNLDRYGHGIVHEHEALERFVALFVVRGGRQRECRNSGCMVLFSADRRVKIRREFG